MATADVIQRPNGVARDAMSVAEIEQACDAGERLDFTRHALELADLARMERFYPLGFPVELWTNSTAILEQAHGLWRAFDKRFETPPIRVDVHVTDGDGARSECPPAPSCKMTLPLLMSVADGGNYSLSDLELSRTRIVLSGATLGFRNYVDYFFLGAGPLCHIATRYATPIHAACVSLGGHGVLLCGDSGAGKSTLAYGCARAGWSYVTDDGSMLLRPWQMAGRAVTGDCHQMRLRPSAGELFPEVEGLEITPRAAGKPSIELRTAGMAGVHCAAAAEVDFLVFLNRGGAGRQELVPYRKDVARAFLRQVLFGTAEMLRMQYAEVERLLTASVFELRYRDLDWAIDRLAALVREGR